MIYFKILLLVTFYSLRVHFILKRKSVGDLLSIIGQRPLFELSGREVEIGFRMLRVFHSKLFIPNACLRVSCVLFWLSKPGIRLHLSAPLQSSQQQAHAWLITERGVLSTTKDLPEDTFLELSKGEKCLLKNRHDLELQV